nr:MAG TPA: hypothetical protein [Caudoviricetes sp.]
MWIIDNINHKNFRLRLSAIVRVYNLSRLLCAKVLLPRPDARNKMRLCLCL